MLNLSIYYNKKPSINARAQEIIKDLNSLGYRVALEKYNEKTDLILALGGDGTYLRVAHQVIGQKIPILAVKLGRLGFLSEINGEEIIKALELYQNKKYQLDKRYFLEIKIKYREKERFCGQVLNDAVLARDRISRIIDIKIVSQNKETCFRADGIIIATPTGSTAYNLSAGGPILDHQQKKYLLTPICPHMVNWESLVIDDQVKTFILPEVTRNVRLDVTLDGYKVIKLKKDSVIEVRRSNEFVNFVRFKPFNFKKVFREKFGQGC